MSLRRLVFKERVSSSSVISASSTSTRRTYAIRRDFTPSHTRGLRLHASTRSMVILELLCLPFQKDWPHVVLPETLPIPCGTAGFYLEYGSILRSGTVYLCLKLPTSSRSAHASHASSALSGNTVRIFSPALSSALTSSIEKVLLFCLLFRAISMSARLRGWSEGGVGGALAGTKAGRGLPLKCLIHRSLHDCHG